MENSEKTPLVLDWHSGEKKEMLGEGYHTALSRGIRLSMKDEPLNRGNSGKVVWRGYLNFPNLSSSVPVDYHSIGINFARETKEEAMRALESIVEDLHRASDIRSMLAIKP